MFRRFSLPAFLLALVCSLGVVGCGGSGGEATFEETEAETVDEAAEAAAYEEQMQQDSQRMRKEGN